jgi:hypothetical protein
MVVRLPALWGGRPLPSRKIPGRPQDHSAAGSIRSIEKSNDLLGNQTRDLPARIIVPPSTMFPRAPQIFRIKTSLNIYYSSNLKDSVVLPQQCFHYFGLRRLQCIFF